MCDSCIHVQISGEASQSTSQTATEEDTAVDDVVSDSEQQQEQQQSHAQHQSGQPTTLKTSSTQHQSGQPTTLKTYSTQHQSGQPTTVKTSSTQQKPSTSRGPVTNRMKGDDEEAIAAIGQYFTSKGSKPSAAVPAVTVDDDVAFGTVIGLKLNKIKTSWIKRTVKKQLMEAVFNGQEQDEQQQVLQVIVSAESTQPQTQLQVSTSAISPSDARQQCLKLLWNVACHGGYFMDSWKQETFCRLVYSYNSPRLHVCL